MSRSAQTARQRNRRDFVKGALAGATGALVAATAEAGAAEEPAVGAAAKCGFAKVSIKGTFSDVFAGRWGRDLECRLLYCREGQKQWLLAAFDSSYIFRNDCLKWREAVSKATGIPVSSIWMHATHVHTGPSARTFDGHVDELIARCIPAVSQAINAAEEAELSYAVADLGDRRNCCRDQIVPGLGMISIWGSFHWDDDGRVWFDDPKNEDLTLWAWDQKEPPFEGRVYFDRPGDPQGALLVFRSAKTKKILGHLARFTGHPTIVSHVKPDNRRYDPDWPGSLREALENELGGLGIAVNGPCGDQLVKHHTVPTYEEALAECQRIATGVAEECLAACRSDASLWEPVRLHMPMGRVVGLPLRDTVPRSYAELDTPDSPYKKRFQKADEARRAAGKNAPKHVARRLLDEFYGLNCMPMHLKDWVRFSDAELAARTVDVELSAVRLNDLIFCGWAGENMSATNRWIKAFSFGNRVIQLDEINGYTVYMTTREQFDQGGYSYWCGILDRDADELLRRQALQLLDQAWRT